MGLRIALAYSSPAVARGSADERLLEELARYLREQGHGVDSFVGRRGESQFRMGPEGRSFQLQVPRIERLESYGLGVDEAFFGRALVPFLLHRYDVVHAFTASAAVAAIVARQKTIFTPLANGVAKRRIQRRLFARATRLSTRIATFGADDVSSGRPIDALSVGAFVNEINTNLEPRTGPPRIYAAAGTMRGPVAGVVTAFERVLDSFPDARMTLIGSVSTADAYRGTLDIRERVWSSIDLTPTARPDEYRDMSVTVVPSRGGTGRSVIESLAYGTPVVTIHPSANDGAHEASELVRSVDGEDIGGLTEALSAGIAASTEAGTPTRCREAASSAEWALVGPRFEDLYRSTSRRSRP